MSPIPPPYASLNFWLVLVGIAIMLEWSRFFLAKKKHEKEFFRGDFDKRNKLLDIQFKRLGFRIFAIVTCIICYGIYNYIKNNEGFYFKEFTVSANLEASGLNVLALKAQLQEINEAGQDYDYVDLTHERISRANIAEKEKEPLDISFQVQGIGFSLTHIANNIGASLFGNKQREITVNLIEDSVAFKSIITITGLPVKIFVEYMESNYNRDEALQNILEKTEYNILETVSPIVMANYYYNKLDFPRAMAILYRHLNTPSDPFYFNALYRVCYNCHEYNYYECESRWLDTATIYFPIDKYFLNIRACRLREKGEYKEALTYVDNILKQDSTDYYGNITKGTILQKLGETDNAILHFKKALLNNGFRDAEVELDDLFRLNFLFLTKGMTDSAEKYYLQAIDFDDNSIRYANDSANMWLDSSLLNKYGSAEKVWTHIQSKYPGYIPASYVLAVIYKQKGQPDSAEKYLRICLAKKPNLTNARLLLGQIWLQDKTPSADSIADILMLERPYNFNALLLKAETQEILGNKEEAQKKYETVLQYDRLNWIAVERLALILFEKGNNDAVMALTRKYIESYPTDPLLNHLRGILFATKQKFRQGAYYCTVAINNKIEQFYPDMSPMSYKAAGMCNFALQNDDIAIVYLEKYRSLVRRFGKEADKEVLYTLMDLYERNGNFDKQKNINTFFKKRK